MNRHASSDRVGFGFLSAIVAYALLALVLMLGAWPARADAQTGGSITGTVTAADGGAPLAGVQVYLYNAAGDQLGRLAVTNASGVYSLSTTGLAWGTYHLATTNTLGYVDELYNDKPCPGRVCSTGSSGTNVIVTENTVTSGINFALALGGTITGAVTAAAGGAPLKGVTVQLYNVTGSSTFITSTTDAAGVYSLSGLPGGAYWLITTNTLGYIDELYSGIRCAGGRCTSIGPSLRGMDIVVTAGQTTSGKDFALTVGGTITGTVTSAATGLPVGNASIVPYNGFGLRAGNSAVTDASGVYTVRGLDTGWHFLTINASGYVDQLFDGKPCLNLDCDEWRGTPVPVTAGDATTGIDATLATPGVITGTITAAGSGTPLANVRVRLYDSSGDELSSYSQTLTNASGVYTWTGMSTGTYHLVTSNTLGYVDELYNDVACPNSTCVIPLGVDVKVTPGATTSGINFSLAAGGAITGTVTNATTGAPVASTIVYVYSANGQNVGYGFTNASGVYTKSGLTTGTYHLKTSQSLGYIDELYNDTPCAFGACTVTAGTGVNVVAGATTSAVDFGLSLGGTITGTVTDASTHAPLASTYIHIYSAGGTALTSFMTDALGAYTKSGFPTGTYYVKTVNYAGYLDELHSDMPCMAGTCTVTSGTAVGVAAPATTGGIDFALTRGGAITGTVTVAGAGTPLAGANVYILTGSGSVVSFNKTNSLGLYTATGLATGTYYVRTTNSLGYVDELYNDLPCPGGRCTTTSGGGVNVTVGATTSAINFGLMLGGTITGTVTDVGNGAPLNGAYVYAYNSGGQVIGAAGTNGAGIYAVMGLPTGVYYVGTRNNLGYVDELFDNLPWTDDPGTITGGTGVIVAAGATSGAVDFGLARGGSISGVVTDAAMIPLAGVRVEVLSAGGTLLSSAYSSTSGYYAIQPAVPTGTYFVRTFNTSGYIDELYDNLPCPGGGCTVTTGTGVGVVAGASARGIHFALAAGGLISGTVTDNVTGAPVGDVSVYVYGGSGNAMGSAVTASSGVYTTAALPTGTYYLRTSNSLGFGDELYNDLPCPGGACAVTAGTGVHVAAGATTGGIEFGLTRRGGGDFTGDHTSDLLWRGTEGDLWLWPMSGAAKVSEHYVLTVADPNWEIRGQGDLNGDGTADLLWRNKTDGMVYYWPMANGVPSAQRYVATVGTDYDIIGTGDFDGDGKADLLWRHTTGGDLWVWLMNGATVMSETYVGTVELRYAVKGVGDLSGDLKADLVWSGPVGDVWVWLMNGATKASEHYVSTVADATYQIQQVADFDGNGKADLLWWNTAAGDVWIWPMNGAVVLSETYVGVVPDTNYRIQASGDYDGNGKADILWRNIVQGDVWVWLMDGTTKLSEHYVGVVPDLGYQIERSR